MSLRFIPHQERLAVLEQWIIECIRQGDKTRRLKVLKFLASEARARMADPEEHVTAIEARILDVMASQTALGFDMNLLAELGKEVMRRQAPISDALRLRAKQRRVEA